MLTVHHVEFQPNHVINQMFGIDADTIFAST